MKDKNTYSVYIHKNKINNKCYVGITKNKPSDRWGYNGYKYKGQQFYKAIRKYGWDTFEHIILTSRISKDKAEQLEILYISIFKSNQNDYGYNISSGGEIGTYRSLPVSQYTLEGRLVNTFDSITIASKNTNIDISAIAKCCRKERPMAGRYLWSYTNESPVLGYKEKVVRKVSQYTLDCKYIKTYNSAKEAEIENGIYDGGVLDCCKGRQRTAFNFKWVFEGDFPNIETPARDKIVCQYSMNGELIATFNNATDAGRKTNMLRDNISNCCNKKTKSAGGYIFAYEGEDIDLNVPIRKKQVNQYSLNGDYINTYESTCEANTKTGVRSSGISLCCNGKLKTSGGFIWRYTK